MGEEDELKLALELESKEFEQAFHWLKKHLPPVFFEEVDFQTRVLISRNLMSFQLQDYFSEIHIKNLCIVLSRDGPDADIRILKNFLRSAIRYYRTFVSDAPPPKEKKGRLRVTILQFQEEEKQSSVDPKLIQQLLAKNRTLQEKDVKGLLKEMSPRFIKSLKIDRLALALGTFMLAKTKDACQYEVRRNEDWETNGGPSLQVVFAWKDVPKSGFLYRLARIVHSHNLAMRHVAATYIEPFGTNNIVILSLGLHGLEGKAAWDTTDIDDFMRELCLAKFFESDDAVAEVFVKTKQLSGNEAHLVRNFANFAHQVLLLKDPNLYTLENVYESLCRHTRLTVDLCKLFEAKFRPDKIIEAEDTVSDQIEKIDTGHPTNDLRRKNVLKQVKNFIDHTLKTNFYEPVKTGFSFRLDPEYLNHVPFNRTEKFPEMPYGIFFIRGMHFLGFNIRFKDLARGGVRTVAPERWESYFQERNNIFSECYNLAYTQQKKNKDIPEGGAKTVILLAPYEVFAKEEALFVSEMENLEMEPAVIEQKLQTYRKSHKESYLYASQRCFIESWMTLINCEENGTLKAKTVRDYWKRPEYIYLGPDERMYDPMIDWIAKFSVDVDYKPGRSFMSSKPKGGINHKEYGITSYGVNVYLHQTLLHLGIDPSKDPFTVKMTGGPDGDVAGNEIHILATQYPKTAKLLALTDGSGTVFDPSGLDWKELDLLFKGGKPIRFYSPEKLHDGGFLLDLYAEKIQVSEYEQHTPIYRKKGNKVIQDKLTGPDASRLFQNNVHKTVADLFVPAGGRPRTLNESNVTTFLDEAGKPTAKAIIEGANLYPTPAARRFLEERKVLVLKDSSCNKGGVICSSFEVLAGLCLSEQEFLKEKATYVTEVKEIIRKAALNEATLLLHSDPNLYLTDISDQISEKINLYKYQLLDYLETITLSKNKKDPLICCLIKYCPPILQTKYTDRILSIPDIHKKAIIAVFLASHLVYTRGTAWAPSVADILDTIATDPRILGE
jgi:glutamate dehydrogenase